MSRISKVVTRTGDKGQTSLGDGSRVSKSHSLIYLLGEIDELNSQLGNAITSCGKDSIILELQSIQQDLFNMGAEVSIPETEMNLLEENRVTFLEERIINMNDKLPQLKEFILPGGNELCSKIHILRSICRRVERSCVKVMEEGANIRFWLLYLNRLSDYFFVLSRHLSQEKGGDEILWDRNK